MKYFIIAGEASGDMHAASLMRSLKAEDAQADFCFLGGDLMLKQGGRIVKHYRDMAFMGIVNVALNIGKVLRNMKDCQQALLDYRPDVVILVDYPGFNLKIAKFVKERLSCPVYYYISPKLWAWKSYRIKTIKRYVDRMFTIFPFETAYFARLGYSVDYVGNPTADLIADFMAEEPRNPIASERHIVALLAGSRKQEIKKCLPIMTAMAARFPDYHFVVAAAPGIDPDFYRDLVPDSVSIVEDNTYSLVRHATAAIVNSGTATLETALIGAPQVVVYHVIGGRFAAILRKILIKIPYISLVNLVAERYLVTELIMHHFNETNLTIELEKLLFDDANRRRIAQGYSEIKQKLGYHNAAQQTAKLIVSSHPLEEKFKLENSKNKNNSFV